MGQEVGHAYEDLLELALERLLPALEKTSKQKFRLSPVRRMVGVSGNIDHLVECSVDGDLWTPYCLFMEKHSDSADESHKHLRRHLEEYVQAKISSVLVHGFSEQHPLKVINLIYGTATGWKPKILDESRRLLYPSLILMDEKYYESLDKLVREVISEFRPPYDRRKIRASLRRLLVGNSVFEQFSESINQALRRHDKPPKRIHDWISAQIVTAKDAIEHGDRVVPVAYYRKAMTELLIMHPAIRKKVLRLGAGDITLSRSDAWTVNEIRSLQLASVGFKIKKSIGASRVELPSYVYEYCRQERSKLLLEDADAMFMSSSSNAWGMGSSDYLAYFDLRDEEFTHFLSGALLALEKALSGKKVVLKDFLAKPTLQPSAVTECTGRKVSRVQNLCVEAVMAVASTLGRDSMGSRTDLSTSTLAKYSGCTESQIQSFRKKARLSASQAENVARGVHNFLNDLPWTREDLVRWLQEQAEQLRKWMGARSVTAIGLRPRIVDPEVVMSMTWFRHNQLNGHSIFNPLSAIVFLSHRQELDGNLWQSFGFPQKRSANLVDVVPGMESVGADYEFSIVFWNQRDKQLRVLETSSVINLKHTSDKCKELSAKMRAFKPLLLGKCQCYFELVLDGDWTAEHVKDLALSGWDKVSFSVDYV